jgi:L-threonylcarbamoyladenylate synthase
MILLPTRDGLRRAAEIIRLGGVVAFPTETVYGLGANAFNADAVKRVFELKQRPFASPLIVHAGDAELARTVTREWPPLAETLSRHFWPGPLTMVLAKAPIVPDLVTAGLPSVGVRVPAHPIAVELIRQSGVPIAAPSANLFTQISPTTAQHVEAALGGKIEIILDGGRTQVGIESTVIALRSGGPVILRPGMISQSQLEEVTGLQWQRELNLPRVREAAESPGQHLRHYAPRTPFYVLEPGAQPPMGRGKMLNMPGNRYQFAASLYAVWHQADSYGWDWIAL